MTCARSTKPTTRRPTWCWLWRVAIPKTFRSEWRPISPSCRPGSPAKQSLKPPSSRPGTRISIIKRETRATALSLGFPIDVTRADKDWPALAVVASYFGQHRSSNSYLYQRLREARGLNYGDYAYIEYFPRGMFQFTPDPNLGRSSQIFQIWIRPVDSREWPLCVARSALRIRQARARRNDEGSV